MTALLPIFKISIPFVLPGLISRFDSLNLYYLPHSIFCLLFFALFSWLLILATCYSLLPQTHINKGSDPKPYPSPAVFSIFKTCSYLHPKYPEQVVKG